MDNRNHAGDPVDDLPPTEVIRQQIMDAIRRAAILRSLLRVAIRRDNWPKPGDSNKPEAATA